VSPFVKQDDRVYHSLRCTKCDYGLKKRGSGIYRVYQSQGKLYLVCIRCNARYEFHTCL